MPTAPLDTVQTVLNMARQRLNDMVQTPAGAPAGQVGGEVLGDTYGFTQVAANSAWRRLQDYLSSKEYPPLVNTIPLSGVSATGTTDAGINCYINFANYFDGSVLQLAPVLPQDLLTPLRLRERPAGTGSFTPMQYIGNGMTGLPKRNRNFQWAWDAEAIIFPGSTQAMDLELRYAQFESDFEDNVPLPVPWYNQNVPLLRVADSFAWYLVFEICSGRGDPDAAAIEAKAMAAADALVARENRNEALRSEWVVPDIPPETGATVLDYVSTALNQARTICNRVNKIAGDVIDPNSAQTQQYTNRALRRLQEYLANKGSVQFTNEIFVTGLTACTSSDPATQVSLSWDGYYDGTTVNPAILLPQDFMMPWKLAERISNQAQLYQDMLQILNGLPNFWTRSLLNCQWEWRNNKIYMPGATGPTDLRIRYHSYAPDFVNNGNTPWYLSQIPIPRAATALAAYICVEIAQSVPDSGLDPVALEAMAEDAANMVFNRDVRRTAQTTITRRSMSGRLEGGNGFGYFW